jgi:hypothetical protein
MGHGKTIESDPIFYLVLINVANSAIQINRHTHTRAETRHSECGFSLLCAVMQREGLISLTRTNRGTYY